MSNLTFRIKVLHDNDKEYVKEEKVNKTLYAKIEGNKLKVEMCNFAKDIIIIIENGTTYEYEMSDVEDLILE